MPAKTAFAPSLYPLLEDIALKCESLLVFRLDSLKKVIPTPHDLSADPSKLEELYACGVIGEQSQVAISYANACICTGIANACREAMRGMSSEDTLEVTPERSEHARPLWPLVISHPGSGECIRALSVIISNSSPAVRAVYADRIRHCFTLSPLQEASLTALVN
jgi:hypothetical protein